MNFNAARLPETEVGSALGLYLWMWGIFTGMLFLCTFASPRALQLLFLLLTVTFVLLGIGNSGASSNMVHAGGYVGIATGAVALYIACADIMQAVYKRSVLPGRLALAYQKLQTVDRARPRQVGRFPRLTARERDGYWT